MSTNEQGRRDDANAAAIGEHVARRLNCATVHDVPDVLRRVLASNADVATYMRQRDEAEGSARLDRERADALRAENARQRARAEAAEAECARLRAEVDAAHERSARWQTERDAARAEADALRAIVEGRDVAPTRDAIDAHHATGGRWLAQWSNGTSTTVQHPSALSHLAEESCEPGRRLRVVRWWALDATGRPCAWPTVTP